MFLFSPTPTLSLKKFEVNPEQRTVVISGRASGIIGFLLNLFGISPTTTLTLMSDRIEEAKATIGTQTYRLFPLPAVESTACGHKRNMGYLVTAATFLILGLANMLSDPAAPKAFFVVFFVLAALMVLAFFMSRRLFIGVFCGSQVMQLAFKEATVGGQRIDKQTAMAAIAVINDRIVDVHAAAAVV